MLRIDSRNVWIFSAIERLKETTVEMQQITQSLQNLQLEVQLFLQLRTYMLISLEQE